MSVEQRLNEFAKFTIERAKGNLSRLGKKDTSTLINSMRYSVKVSPNSFEMSINMADYGKFVDKGVKGVSSSAKAPSSPYKFGTGSGTKGGLTDGINGWVRRKRFQFRDKNGKFMSYEQTAFAVRRSIWHKGIKTTNFFTDAFERQFKSLPDSVTEAYGLDVENLLKYVL